MKKGIGEGDGWDMVIATVFTILSVSMYLLFFASLGMTR